MRSATFALIAGVLGTVGAFWNANSAAANPCAIAAEEVQLTRVEEGSGIGGSGFGDEGSGMGGSGLADESGIGGSGLFGTISGFASVCVNGVEVQIGDATTIERFGREAAASELAIGQVVWIEATSRAGELVAEHISVLTAAAGVIGEVDASAARMRIDAQWIALTPDMAIFDDTRGQPVELSSLAAGQYAIVSGLPGADGRIVASRVERSTVESGARADLVSLATLIETHPNVKVVWVEGHLMRFESQEALQVGDAELAFVRPDEVRARFATDTRVLLRARVDTGGTLRVELLSVVPQRAEPVRPARPDLVQPVERSPDSAGSVVPSRPDRPQQSAPAERPVRPEKPVRPDRPTRPERVERPTAIDRP